MATIVIEDGTGKTDSNSYASEAQLTSYATDRGLTISGTPADLLIKSMDYIEQQNFKGSKNTKEQALVWPRWGVYIDNFAIDSDEIPLLLQEAQMEVALGVDAGNDPLATVDRETKREKVDVIEVEYMDSARSQPYLKAAEFKLSKLLKSGSRGMSAVAIRA
jgi:hypothetical protein